MDKAKKKEDKSDLDLIEDPFSTEIGAAPVKIPDAPVVMDDITDDVPAEPPASFEEALPSAAPAIADAEQIAPVPQTPMAQKLPAPAMQAPAAPMPMQDEVAAPAIQAPEEQTQLGLTEPSASGEHSRSQSQNAMQAFAENMAFSDDLSTGKIAPKTYADLMWNNRSTLGKIGSIFGLILSGAGSALANQPNAAMEMMNNEINRDLEAQKANAQSKTNWYKAALDHETNLSNIDLNASVAAAHRVGAWNSESEAKMKEYRNNTIIPLNKAKAEVDAKNNMMSAYIQYQQDNINRMAPGPLRDKAQSDLNDRIKPAAAAKMQQNQETFFKKKAVIDTLHPNPLAQEMEKKDAQMPNVRGPVIDDKKYRSALQQGAILGPDALMKRGAIPANEVPAVEEEIKSSTRNRSNYADWLEAISNLHKMKFAGQIPGGKLTAPALSLAGSIAGMFSGPMAGIAGNMAGSAAGSGVNAFKNEFERARNIEIVKLRKLIGGNNESDSSKDDLINALVPSWQDDNKNLNRLFEKGTNYFKTLDSDNSRLRRYEIGVPFPEVKFHQVFPFPKKK